MTYVSKFLEHINCPKYSKFDTPTTKICVNVDLKREVEKNTPYFKPMVVFKSTYSPGIFFRIKDFLVTKINSGGAYRSTCSNCKVTYYEKMFHHVLSTAFKHI